MTGAATLALAMSLLAQETPEALLQRAQALMQAADYDQAVGLLEQLLEQQPNDGQLHFWLGQAQFFAGRIVDAIPHLERARDASGGSGAVQFVLGQAYLEAGRLQEADSALAAAQAQRPDHAPIHLMRGTTCYQAGRLQAADAYFARAAELAPSWELPLFRRGTLALDRDDPDAAAVQLERAAQLRPGDAQILLVLATARSDQHKPTAALELVQRAATAAPDFEPARMALLERLDLLDRADELLAEVDDVLARWPDNASAHYYRASQLSLRGDLDTALHEVEAAERSLYAITPTLRGVQAGDVWRRAGELRPQAMRLRADLLARQDRRDEAIQAARLLVAEHPGYADGHFLLGNLLRRAGDAAGARAELERFKALSDLRLRRSSAVASLDSGEIERARQAFEEALAAAPRDPEAIIGLARAHRLRGDPQAAIELLSGARGLGAAAANWYEEWILALADRGQRAEAARAFGEARRINLGLTPTVWAAVIAAPEGC